MTLAAIPGLVKATPVSVTIDDLTDAATIDSSGFNVAYYHSQGTESPGFHGEWPRGDPIPPIGTAVTYTVALCETAKEVPGATCTFDAGGNPTGNTVVSDILQITLTEEQVPPSNNNVALD